jgi:hypothetical protein
MRVNYLVYHPVTGRICRTGVCEDDTVSTQPGPGEAALMLAGTLDEALYYVDLSGPEPDLKQRPALGFDKATIIADGQDQAVLIGLPDPCRYLLDGQEREADGGTLALAALMAPAVYQIEVPDPFPALPLSVEIAAVAPEGEASPPAAGIVLLEKDLPALKAAARARVNAAAEAARQAYITPGAGQALEYQATETEARTLLALPDPAAADPAALPFLVAEQAALASQGQRVTLSQVAAQVLALASAWAQAGARIKELRRGAVLAIDAAANPVEIEAAEVIDWPRPE